MAIRVMLLMVLAALSFCDMVCAEDESKLPGSAISIEDAVAKADAVIAGKLTSIGTQDMSADHNSAGPEYHDARIEFKGFPLKGAVPSIVPVSIYPNTVMRKEETPKVGERYLSFIIKNGPGLPDPYTVLKFLPDTEQNFKAVALEILKAKLTELEKEK